MWKYFVKVAMYFTNCSIKGFNVVLQIVPQGLSIYFIFSTGVPKGVYFYTLFLKKECLCSV